MRILSEIGELLFRTTTKKRCEANGHPLLYVVDCWWAECECEKRQEFLISSTAPMIYVEIENNWAKRLTSEERK